MGWDVDPEDWDPRRTAAQVVATIRAGVSARPTSVVLLHAWAPATMRAVASTIRTCGRSGTAFVMIDELAPGERPAGMPAEARPPA